jgi:hypothetical protein
MLTVVDLDLVSHLRLSHVADDSDVYSPPPVFLELDRLHQHTSGELQILFPLSFIVFVPYRR